MAPSAIGENPALQNGENNYISDVCIVGAGPAGLMLADNLTRFGIRADIIDERPDQTSVGRADGLQPKTIETLRMLRLADDLIRVSTKVYDICIWGYDGSTDLKRQRRDIHYPQDVVDVLDPYILLCHQGMVEGRYIQMMKDRGVEVRRNTEFKDCKIEQDGSVSLRIECCGSEVITKAKYLVGCDGAHSKVRKTILGADPEGTSSESVWGVLDGELNTDFPDIWSKTIVAHPQYGSVLIIPRERNMTRLYIELKAEDTPGASSMAAVTQETVMKRARAICKPFKLDWTTVEWFGRYQIGQRVARKFMDDSGHVFIAGDASHTHSPKAAQGMNTSIHDSWNLGWKLNLHLRDLAKPALLQTYENERRKIAQDLIDFDYEHANHISAGNSKALAENFRTNMGFISGVGVTYLTNVLNSKTEKFPGDLKPGNILPPARAIRYVDHNPIHLQLDIPILGQFRVYIIVGSVSGSSEVSFLQELSSSIISGSSLMNRVSVAARKSYTQRPRLNGTEDIYFRHERYTTLSDLFTFALITTAEKSSFEIEQLPTIFSMSPWTIYLDSIPELDTQGKLCTTKWLDNLSPGEVAIVNVRPDNYVGSLSRWNSAEDGAGTKAAEWLDTYYDGFLQA